MRRLCRHPMLADVGRHIDAIASDLRHEDADRWARAVTWARLVPDDVNLDDEADVICALLCQRLETKDFADVLPMIIGQAKTARKGAVHG